MNHQKRISIQELRTNCRGSRVVVASG